jgi:serine phosphatase RsbU (regulator of sigma subunit)
MDDRNEADASSTMTTGIATVPDSLKRADDGERSSTSIETVAPFQYVSEDAAHVLVKHLFAQPDSKIPGISYAVTYRLAEGLAGGDIVDVYHFDNDSVAFSIADIAGKGTRAAVHAALVKYGLRAYASEGLTPEKVLRSLDRLYLENNTFEGMESFATVFFGLVDPSRRLLTYACAAHEPALIVYPNGEAVVLEPTAPLIGVFDDQHHLFKQNFVELRPGTLFVAATDGVTEARTKDGELFGMARFAETIVTNRHRAEIEIVSEIVEATERHCGGRRRDDIAVLVARIH